jgi:hypothetical protein
LQQEQPQKQVRHIQMANSFFKNNNYGLKFWHWFFYFYYVVAPQFVLVNVFFIYVYHLRLRVEFLVGEIEVSTGGARGTYC